MNVTAKSICSLSDVNPALDLVPRKSQIGPGFYYLLAVPLAAGVAGARAVTEGGFNYTGFVWLFFLAVGLVLIVAQKARPGESRIYFPVGCWLLWFGYVWLSLSWCEGMGLRNIQDALQISMPLVVGVAGSLFVQSEDQLEKLLRVFRPALLLLLLCPAAEYVGLLDAFGLSATMRPLALTAALIGCVFMSEFPGRLTGPLFGWAICIVLTVLTGSRMATLALLVIPALHPLYRSRLANAAVVVAIAGLGIALFYTPIFQQRFFYEGSGTLSDVASGDFLSFGRFETWPDIWDEAWRRPYLGAGVGSVYDFVPTVWEDMRQVHNDYLRVGFELGLVGLAVFLSVLLWQLHHLNTQIRQSDGVVRAAFVAVWLGFLLFMITAATDNTLSYNLWYMNPLFAVLGAAYGVAGHSGGQPAPRRVDVVSTRRGVMSVDLASRELLGGR